MTIGATAMPDKDRFTGVFTSNASDGIEIRGRVTALNHDAPRQLLDRAAQSNSGSNVHLVFDEAPVNIGSHYFHDREIYRRSPVITTSFTLASARWLQRNWLR